MRKPTPVAARVIACFDDAPRGDRFHVRARWWTCPLPAIEARVPKRGRVLELGCGHGLLSMYLAATAPARTVTGVDIDAHKIQLAEQAAAGFARGGAGTVSFAAVASGELPDGPFDAIVISDVLYLLPDEQRRSMLAGCVERLAPGGVVVVKELDVQPRWKYLIGHAQEIVATRVLRYTAGEQVEIVPMQELADVLVELGLDAAVERIDHGFLHPHAIIVARRPPA